MESSPDEQFFEVDYGDPASVEQAVAARKEEMEIFHQARIEELELRLHEDRMEAAQHFRKQFDAYENHLGRKLRDWRKARGWSQARIAEELGYRGFDMHQTTVAKIENGSRPLRVSEAIAIADVMGMPMLSVFYGPGPEDKRWGIDAMRDAMERSEQSLEFAQEQMEQAMKQVLYYENERASWAQSINRSALEFDQKRESDESGS